MPLRSRLILFAVLLGVIAAARWFSYDEPLERDIAIYSVIGKEMLKGRALYSDLWDHKPPGVYLIYAFANAVSPSPRAAIYLLNVSMAFVTMLGTARIAERFKPNWIWIWAAVCWVVVSGAHSLQANQPNVEVFMNAGIVWFLVLCIPGTPPENESRSRWRWVRESAVLAVTSLFKQVVVVTGLYLAVAFAITSPEEKRRAVIKEWARIAVFGLVFWIAVMLVFAFNGHFAEFYQAVFEYNSEYSGSLLDNMASSLSKDNLAPGFMEFLWPLGALTVFGIVAGWHKPETRRFSGIMLALCMATYVQVAMPGKFFPHYFQLWLPVLVIGAACGLSTIPSSKAALVAAAVALLLPLRSEVNGFQLTPEDWSRSKYGDEFVIDKQMATELRAMLQPGETFYHWGNQPSLYFETGVSPPTGVFFSLMMFSPLLQDPLAFRTLNDLRTHPPDLYVQSADWVFPPNAGCADLKNWLLANYRLMDGGMRHGKFLLYARVGTALDKRYPPVR